jgi:hypothetical protein
MLRSRKLICQVRNEQEVWKEDRRVALLGSAEFEMRSGAKAPFWACALGEARATKVQYWRARARAKNLAEKDFRRLFLSKEERALAEAEDNALKNMGGGLLGWCRRIAYQALLNPLAPLHDSTSRSFCLPDWCTFLVHAFCIVVAGLCTYYVILFSVMLNTCAPCSPEDKNPSSQCKSCPKSMKTNSKSI